MIVRWPRIYSIAILVIATTPLSSFMTCHRFFSKKNGMGATKGRGITDPSREQKFTFVLEH